MPDVQSTTSKGALRALISGAQQVLGCPEWCTWSGSAPRHEHVTIDRAEAVVLEVYDPVNDDHVLELLEVRHSAAPSRP